MAKYTYYFPNGQYPEDYLQNFNGVNYNPALQDLLAGGSYTKSTSTIAIFHMTDGIDFQIIGSGLTYDQDGTVDGGLITTLKLLEPDHKTVMQAITGLTISGQDLKAALTSGSSYATADLALAGNDTVTGSAGGDSLYGGPGQNTLLGKGGDDYLIDGRGVDTFDGGAGSNTIFFSNAYFDADGASGVTVDAVKGTDVDPWGNHETFKNVTKFRGTQFADHFAGSSKNESFQGLGGKDVIDGGGGEDIVRYIRDAGFGGTAGVTVNLAKGTAIDGFGDRDTLKNIEDVEGTNQKDSIVGSGANNLLQGDSGADRLTGGAGADTFFYASATDTTVAASGRDTIVDFSGAQGDAIDFAFLGSGTTLSFTENAAKTSGILKVKNGSVQASIVLDGAFIAANFVKAADGSGGTRVTYTATDQSGSSLAVSHA